MMKIGKYRVTELASIMFLAFGAFAVVYLFFKYIALTVLPFLIGWAFAFSVRPIACAVSKRTHIPVKVLRLFMTLSCLAVSGVLLWLGIGALWKEGVRLISYLEENPHIFDSMFEAVSRPSFGGRLEKYIADIFSGAVNSITEYIARVAGKILTSLPGIFFFVIVSIISAVYFSLDLDNINRSVLSIVPERVGDQLKKIRCGIFKNFFLYIRSYALLMIITFIILSFGLVILGVDYALLLAVIFSFVDALPVLGIGTVLVPWAIYEIAAGNSSLGFGLLILFAVAVVIREALEPKILGTHLGVHPVITLVFLYGGYRLCGITGMILSPFAALLFRILMDRLSEYLSARRDVDKDIKER